MMYEKTKKPNRTGIPDSTKQSIERRSGFSMDDVKVHYHSSKPAQLQALAYTQGTNVYIASGQEKHLMHELTHVVQQKQGIVRANTSLNGVSINYDRTLENEADRHYIRPTASSQSDIPPVAQCLFDSYTLAGNIGTRIGEQAHHIIPIEVINECIKSVGIFDLHEFDKDWNGIALPCRTPLEIYEFDTLPIHLGSHPHYTKAVKEYLQSNNKMSDLVTNLNCAKEVANHFRAIINDYHNKNVPNIDYIDTYFQQLGHEVMRDFVYGTELIAREQEYGLSPIDQRDLDGIKQRLQYNGVLDGEDFTEIGSRVLSFTNNGQTFDINAENQRRLGKLLKGFTE